MTRLYPNGDQMAYPVQVTTKIGAIAASPGLTKRELFAAMAMQGLCSRFGTDKCVTDALRYADALLAALAVTP